MQQRQLRLGDILDDYCPRERRVTNHAVVAMVGADVKQTRCTTCDAEHEYKHAKVPRQRRKADTPAALYAQVAANGPKRVTHEAGGGGTKENPGEDLAASVENMEDETSIAPEHLVSDNGNGAERPEEMTAIEAEVEDSDVERPDDKEGPVHRPLIRASLPRPEGQQPPARPIQEFTIRQPAGRPGRFRPRHQRGGPQAQHFHGSNRGNGNMGGGPPRGMRPGGSGRPQGPGRRQGPGRKRSK